MGAGVDWLGFALAILLIELTPGPNMAWLAALTLGEGKRSGLSATAGVAIGLLVNGFVAAVGVAALVAAEPRLMQAMRWAGMLFLLWLAWQAWRDAGEASQVRRQDPRSSVRHFLAGLVTNLLNPKALLFYVVLIPQFLHQQAPTIVEAFSLTLVSVCIATAVHLAIVLMAGKAHDWLDDPAKTRTVRRVLALVLVGVAIWFASGTALPVSA